MEIFSKEIAKFVGCSMWHQAYNAAKIPTYRFKFSIFKEKNF